MTPAESRVHTRGNADGMCTHLSTSVCLFLGGQTLHWKLLGDLIPTRKAHTWKHWGASLCKEYLMLNKTSNVKEKQLVKNKRPAEKEGK